MVNIGVDTSFVIRLLTGEPAPLAAKALRMMQDLEAKGGHILLSDLVVAETYFALQHHYRVPKAEVLTRLRQFVGSEAVSCTGSAKAILARPGIANIAPGFVDCMIVDHYLGLGADEVVTFDRAARNLPGVRTLK